MSLIPWLHAWRNGKRSVHSCKLKILKLRSIRIMYVNTSRRSSRYNRWSLRKKEIMSWGEGCASKGREWVVRRCTIVKSNLRQNYPFPRMVFRVVYRMYPQRWEIIRRCGDQREECFGNDAWIRCFPANAVWLNSYAFLIDCLVRKLQNKKF